MIQPLSTSRLLSCVFHKCTHQASQRKHDLSFYIFKIPDHMKHNLKANCYAIRVQSQLEMEGKKFKALSGVSKPGSTVTQNWGPAAYHSETNKVLYQLTIKKKKERNTTSLPQLLVTPVKSFAATSNLIVKGICLVQHFSSGLECHHHDFAVSVLFIHYYLLDTLLQSTFIKV